MSPDQPLPQAPLAYIHATGGIGHQLEADQSPPSLRAAAKERFGPALRQASRFVELALLGVADCLQSHAPIDAQFVPVYVATGLGEVQKTMTLFGTVTGAIPEPAAPFDFINAANNTAGFYIAKHYTGSARNFTISDGNLSFESALQLALLECRHAPTVRVLVGGVDEAIASRSEYLRRYAGADPAGTIGEGSYWFLLSSQATGAIGEVLHADVFTSDHEENADANRWAARVAQALRDHTPKDSTLYLLPGAGLDEPLTAVLTQHMAPLIQIKNKSMKSYSYPTSIARTLSDWLRRSSGSAQAIPDVAYVSRDSHDSQGRTAITVIRNTRR